MRYIASPAVRAHAGAKGVDLDKLAAATGRETLAREDVDRYIAGTAPDSVASDGLAFWDVDHAAFGQVRSEPMSRFAKVAASNISAAQTHIPAVTHHDRAETKAVETMRAALKPEAEVRGVKLTALTFYLKALARALRDFPRFNASLSRDAQTLYVKDYVHIGIAVDTEHGLMVPVIRNADRKGLWQIAEEIADLATRARGRKIRPDEMGGASMSVTNLGGIGGHAFSPIVNPPELAILGLTRTETVTVWDGETPRPVAMVPLHLSYDHRVINGAEAARFTARLASLIADPRRLLI